MTDITPIFDLALRLCSLVMVLCIIPLVKSHIGDERFSRAIKVSEEIAKIAYTVVSAANELEITGELVKMGKSKAQYALDMAKAELNAKGITFDEDELISKIKAAVTELRINISGTDAEAKKDE